MDWLLLLGMLLIALFAAIGGMVAVHAFEGPKKPTKPSIFTETTQGTVFLFDGETLIDSTPGARTLLASSPARGGHWLRLISYLSPMFADIEAKLKDLPNIGTLVLDARTRANKPLMLLAEYRGGITRVALRDPLQDTKPVAIDALSFRAQSIEVEQLRDALAKSPALIWRESAEGEVIWANAPYILHAASLLPAGRELGWPMPRLFEGQAGKQTAQGQRAKFTARSEGDLWFDLVGFPDKDEKLLFALPADAAVRAEAVLRDFMQTLTKTFAQISMGLAIFDRQRQLQLFNPALLDLTGLPVDFLSMRPSLIAVLDALRDRNMLPEPKDYHKWRRELVELERAAAQGLYEETWSLPGGQTYRVTGRPHPNGALALMIEDISGEVSRTRRYRQDLELGQSVIDTMDEALVVFSASGQLVMSNTAYAQLWMHDPEADVAHASLRQIVRHWQASTAPSGLWAEAEEFLSTVGARLPWTAEARLLDGRLVDCRFVPLASGASLAAFRISDRGDVVLPRISDGPARLTA